MRNFAVINPNQDGWNARPTHMHLSRITFVLLATAFFASSIHAQDSVTTMGQGIPSTRSRYFGNRVEHPEALSGIWEAPDGQRGAVGIHMDLTTNVSDDSDPPSWTPETWLHLNLGVFHRRGLVMAFGEDGYFSDSPGGVSVKLEEGHLQLQFVSPQVNEPSVDIDLARQADDCWHGRFHRGSFDKTVTLCRPTPGPGIQQSRVVGTWSYGSSCIHIAQTGAGTFTGWSDSHRIPGSAIYRPNYPPPHLLIQSYGTLAKVLVTGDRSVSLELSAYTPMCCSHLFTGELSADGTEIKGNFPAGPNQIPHAATWKKLPTDSCIDPAIIPKTRPRPFQP